MLGWLSRVLGGSKPTVAEPPLVVQARSDDPAQREAAAGPLAAVPELWAGELLLQMLQDPSAGVRAAAKEGLRKRGVLAAPELLTGLNHADDEVARTAAELLGGLRVPDVVPPLLVALKFGSRPVQLAARRALAQLGPVAVPTLQAAKDDPQYWVRQQVAEILAEIEGAPPAPAPAGT
jgi:HEAT repeat protein